MTNLQHQPSFRIHRADGSVVGTLLNAFVTKRDITVAELNAGEIMFTDGSKWRLIVDAGTYEYIAIRAKAYCIVSFQVHDYGSFAVAKIFRDEAPKKRSGLNRMRIRKALEHKEQGEA